MRELTDHKVNGVNDGLIITVLDEPGQGGACHDYQVADLRGNEMVLIQFQNGPLKEYGVNGVTHEALLAILADRLRSFQTGEFNCKENSVALTHIETAQLWLQKRTNDRLRRGVEGTYTK